MRHLAEETSVATVGGLNALSAYREAQGIPQIGDDTRHLAQQAQAAHWTREDAAALGLPGWVAPLERGFASSVAGLIDPNNAPYIAAAGLGGPGRALALGFAGQMAVGSAAEVAGGAAEIAQGNTEQGLEQLAAGLTTASLLAAPVIARPIKAAAQRGWQGAKEQVAAVPDWVRKAWAEAGPVPPPPREGTRPTYSRKPMDWGEEAPPVIPSKAPPAAAAGEPLPPLPDLGPLGDSRRLALVQRMAAGEPIPVADLQPGEALALLEPAGYVRRGQEWVREALLDQPLPPIGSEAGPVPPPGGIIEAPPVETAAAAAAKVQEHVAEVQARTRTPGSGFNDPQQIKAELVTRLETQIEAAPSAADVPAAAGPVTIDIPGDGVFTVRNTKESLTKVLKRAKRIKTDSQTPEPRARGPGKAGTPPPAEIKTVGEWQHAQEFHELTGTDTIADKSNALLALARRVNPSAPEAVTAKDVKLWIENRRAEKTKGAQEEPAGSVSLGSEASPSAAEGGVRLAEKHGFKLDPAGDIIAFHGTDRPIEGSWRMDERKGAFFSSTLADAISYARAAAKRNSQTPDFSDIHIYEVRVRPRNLQEWVEGQKADADALLASQAAGDVEVRDPSILRVVGVERPFSEAQGAPGFDPEGVSASPGFGPESGRRVKEEVFQVVRARDGAGLGTLYKTRAEAAAAAAQHAAAANKSREARGIEAPAEPLYKVGSVYIYEPPAASKAKGAPGFAAEASPGFAPANAGYPGLNFPKLPGSIPAHVLKELRPMEMPEILRLATELTGDLPTLKRLKTNLGFHKGGKITLDERGFRDPSRLAITLAHELGHANDWFPEGTIKRGNVLGRLIGRVNTFLQGSFGNLSNKEIRKELIDLSAYWHPWDRTTARDNYIKYRDSARELYAEGVSVLLNSPGLLEQKAPKFYQAFFEHLDRKPQFKEEFFALQDLLARGPAAVLGERLKQSREGFEKGEAMLHEKIQLRQAARNSFKDFLTKVRIQSLDIADFVRRRLGSKDPRQATEFDRLYEEWKLDDNKNAADVQRIYHEMIQPVVKAGLDEHAFGQVLELQRIIGSLDAYKDMQAMRATLGPERVELLRTLSDKLAELERKGVAATEAIDQVIVPLERAGLEFDLIDKFRELREAQGTRAELANPQGRSPILAEAELKQLLETVTPEQRAALEQSAAAFRKLIFDRATEARDVGIINQLTFDKTVVANRENYAAFRPLDKIEPFVSPMLRKARGTLKDIENPFITTLLKLQSLNNLIETQRLKNLVRDEMGKLFPTDFVKAPTRWTGRRLEAGAPKPGVGRVNILENGKLTAYDTDPYIAKMFDKLTPTDSFWLNKVLEVPFRMGVYPLIIKYNPGFLFAFNPRRDMARTIRNLYAVEGVTRRELLPNYASPEVLKAVSDYLAGRPNPLAAAMIHNKAITPSWQGFARLDQQDVMTDLLRRYKLAGTPEKNAIARGLMWLPNIINKGGSFLEALPKFASYKTLIERGVGPERTSFLVRNYVGTPNFKIKGEFANVSNSYIPFLNIFTQGWRADLKLATSPKTAGGWWMQWALQHGWQATIVGLAVAGVFGDETRKLYERISEYDLTNYGTLPLGSQLGAGEFGNKTVYLRSPRDPASRFFSAMTYKLTRAAADKVMGNAPHPRGLPVEVFAFGAGVMQSPTPVLNVATAWKDYLSGRNPIDPFRNQPVIGSREFAAGGPAALGDMMTWTLNQSGLLNLIRWNPKAETHTELAVSGLPVVNRLLKISDAGRREIQVNDQTVTERKKAALRLNYSDEVVSMTRQHNWLQSLGELRRSPEQEQTYVRLHAWKTGLYDPLDEAAWLERDDPARQRRAIRILNETTAQIKAVIKPTAAVVYTNSVIGVLQRALERSSNRPPKDPR